MKQQRLYIDTSVFGGYFDDEFEEFTIPLFERINKGEFKILFSTVTQEELKNAMKAITKKEFDAVQFMREQRRILSEKLSKMTKNEIVAYFKKKSVEKGIKPSA